MKKPCRKCGKPSISAICQTCESALERARPSKQARGYDNQYARARARIIKDARSAWARGQAPVCVVCGRAIPAPPNVSAWPESQTQSQLGGSALTVEHIRPLRDGGSNDASNLGPAHASCNYGWRRTSRD